MVNREIIRIFTYIQQKNQQNLYIMSFYKKAKNWASSFWYDDYDTSFDYLETYGSYKPKELDAFKKTHKIGRAHV